MIRRRPPLSTELPMSRVVTGALLLALGSVLTTPALAVDKFAAEFLKVGIGARAMGMGGSFVSLANDASATYWNPAGLVQMETGEAMLMHASQFGGVVNHDVLVGVTPIKASNRSAIGATVIRLAVDDIKVTTGAKVGEDANGNPIIQPELVETRSASDLALLLSYGRGLGDRWALGVNVKLVRQSLVGEGSSFGVGADLGFWFQPNPRLAFGLRMADITTTQLFWDTGRRETVAPTFTLGAHTSQEIKALRGSLTVGLDAAFAFEDFPSDQVSSSSFSGNFLPGLEYWFQRTVALRLGSDGGDFTAGGGVRYKQVGADYAYLAHDELDSTHRISALVRF